MEDSPVLYIPYAAPQGSFDDIDIKLTDQKRVAEFSVTADREILLNNRANARILIDERVNAGISIDLKNGVESIVRQELEDEACLNVLLKWACLQSGDSLKEIFNDSEFVGWQGTFRRIAASFMSMDSMGIVVIKVDGVIFLSETEKRYGEHDSRWDGEEPFYEGFSKFKMTQVMTTTIDGKKDHKKPIDNRPTFEIMVRSELVNSSMNETIPLFIGSSVEALTKEGEPVEFKTIHKAAKFWKKNGKDGAVFRNLNCLLRCDLTDLKWIIFGARDNDFILSKTKTRGRDEFEELINGVEKMAYLRLFDILKGIKRFLTEVDVSSCVVEFPVDTEEGTVIQITEATASETDGVLTEEFKQRFNIQ